MRRKSNNLKKIIITTLLLISVGVLNNEFNNLKNRYTVNSVQSEYDHEEVLSVETETLTTEDMDSLFAEHDEIEKKLEKTVENIQYTIKKGDTISALAKKYNTNMDYLIANNMEIDLNILREGREIKIPSDKGFFYKIEELDSFSTLEKKFNINKDIIQEYNSLETLVPGELVFLREPKLATEFKSKITTFKKITEKKNLQKLAASEKFYNPLNKVIITSSFGTRVHPVLKKVSSHGAVDLRAAIGTKVLAARDGVVKFAGYSGNYGYLVVITHKSGFETRYAHLSKIQVKVGQKVNSKEIIALSGKSGRVSGPHLHYEVRKDGKVLNPTRYMVFNK